MVVVVLLFVLLCYLRPRYSYFFFFNDTATTEIYTLSLHDALPISLLVRHGQSRRSGAAVLVGRAVDDFRSAHGSGHRQPSCGLRRGRARIGQSAAGARRVGRGGWALADSLLFLCALPSGRSL